MQWLILGGLMGFMCSAVLVVGAIAAGLVAIDPAAIAAAQATQTPFIITSTPPPATDTPQVTATLTNTPTTEAPLADIMAPTASPTLNPTFQTLAPTASPTTGTNNNTSLNIPGGSAQTSGAGGQTSGGTTDGVSQSLRALSSEVVLVTGGQFQMGTTIGEVTAAVDECLAGYGGAAGACQVSYGEDAQPQHAVTISSFNMEVTEVSYSQYVAFLNEMGPRSHLNGCLGQPCARTNIEAAEVAEILFDSANYSIVPTLSNFPVANVTWYGAAAYCRAIGRRLPTEAEWERAARGDTGFYYPWGNEWNPNNAATSRSTVPETRVSVTDYANIPSPYGTINQAGNMAEWVNDWYGETYYGSAEARGIDPQGPATGSQKVVRGGAWSSVPFFARTMHRQSWEPNDPQAWIGFRCAEDISTSPGANANTTNAGGLLPGQTAPTPTIDPATLGLLPAGSGDEEGSTIPTLPPAPTTAP
jgi:formylglycine-generating enzyme required for sulfatase activity